MDRLFDDAFRGFPMRAPGGWFAPSFPAVNVWEDAESVYVEAELPGLKLDDLELAVMGDELTIKGERKHVDDEDVAYHRKERGTGCFSRVFRLPVGVNADKVEASLRDGILTVTLPKAAEATPPAPAAEKK